MSFFIPCIPPRSTHQASLRILRRRNGSQFLGKFSSSKGKRTEGELMALLMPHRPPAPLTGPLFLGVEWRYPWRKGEPAKNRFMGYRRCDTRPDCSNLIKLLEDVMTRLGYWGDDAQIALLRVGKMWHDRPGLDITIETI
jgi:Holliday junction resolvase RusA-like endonuclease